MVPYNPYIPPADALYQWLKRGSSAGVRAKLGLGPVKVGGSAGFEAGPKHKAEQVGDYWYEAIPAGDLQQLQDAVEELEEGEWVEVGAGAGAGEWVASETVQPIATKQPGKGIGLQGGFALGPLQLNAGIGAGR